MALAQQPLFTDAMARFAGSVTIVTTRENDVPFGMVATSVCSLSADPPSLIACINKGTSAHDPVLRRKFFAVNLVSKVHIPLVRHFMVKKGADRFDIGDWSTLATGAPILDDAAVAFDCALTDFHDGFTHAILVGTVADFRVSPRADAGCLLWHGRGFANPAPVDIGL